jgi:hypothetical protein
MPVASLPRAISTIRGGLSLGALGAALMAVAPFFDLVDGPAAAPRGGTYVAGIGISVSAIALTACLAILVGVVREVLWIHLLGLVLCTGTALVAGVLVIVARTSGSFADGADVTMRAGALLLVGAFWLALAGIAIALVGIRMVAIAAGPANMARTGPQQRARTAPLAALLGALGVVIVVTSAIAVAYGVLALGDIRSSGERLTGRGMALAGMALGILVLSLLATVGGVGAWVASPGG